MDKYEFQIKTEQLGKLIKKEDYKTAAKIADSIDWRKVRNVGLLLQVAEAYEKTERYEDCYEILNIAYDCAPIGRMIVYKMVEIAVKLKDFEEAVELYKEFVRIAPHDLGRYVLKYEIYKGRGSSIEDQIAILEEYKSREYQEEWAYELAELYYKAGMSLKCVEECDDLILWFSEGEYVIKAMELKMRIQPLTASQEEKYRQMVTDPRTAEEIKVRPVNMEQFNTTNLQAALAEGLEDLIRKETERKAEAPEGQGVSGQKETPEGQGAPGQKETPEGQEASGQKETPEGQEASGQKGTPEKQETSKQQEAPEETSAPDKAEGAGDRGTSAAPAAGQGTAVSWSGASKDTMQLPKFIGQDESGQLTFDMEENVLDRQITGQLSIEDILNDWEVKKRETEAAIAEAAKRDEERRRERERLRATGQLPELNIEVKTTVPEEIQRLIEEIEGRYPVHVELEPIRKKTAESGRQQEKEELEGDTLQKAVPSAAPAAKEPQEILEILEAPAESKGQKRMDSREILDILETASLEELQPAAGQKPEEQPASQKRAEDDARRKAETEQEKEEEPAAPMLEELEKSLEETISAIPPGQLSEEQKKLFAYFTSVRGMNRQLAELLEEDRMRKERREDSLVGNIVITGERGNGKSTLAADIVKALQKQRCVKGAKMAKVAAESLNGKDVSAVVAKLGGGALLIERAGNLKTKTAVQLSHAMTRKTGGLLVILEDDKEEIRKLFIRCESLGAKFTRTIEIPVFTNKELVAFGESYAQERDCVLDEMAVLALYNRIGNNQTSDHLVNVAEVKEMVDEAIEKRGKKGLFGKTKKSRMDEFGHLILLEKDFEK
ncbi:MAG: hypothetical protein ACOX8J_11065 [Candidatus Merdisoma sp.]